MLSHTMWVFQQLLVFLWFLLSVCLATSARALGCVLLHMAVMLGSLSLREAGAEQSIAAVGWLRLEGRVNS